MESESNARLTVWSRMIQKLLLTTIGCGIIASAQPSVVSISPLGGSGSTATFTSVYHHPEGKHYLAYLLVLPTPNVVWFTATGSCLVEYNTFSNGVRLIDDAGTGWHGGQSGVRGPVLSNSHCSVDTTKVQASYSAATKNLTVTVPVTFTGTFNGPLTTFIQEQDSNGLWTGMTQFGNWTAVARVSPKPQSGPHVKSLTHGAYASSGGALPGPLSVKVDVGHTSGTAALSQVHILLSENIVGGTNRCHIVYFRYAPPQPPPPAAQHDIAADDRRLVGDNGQFIPAHQKPYQNSTCRIEGGTLLKTNDTITLELPLQYEQTYVTKYRAGQVGKLNVWVNVFDNVGRLTHWIAPGQQY